MRKKPKPSPDSKARADAIHAQIKRLTSGTDTGEKSEPAGGKTPPTPRDFIQRWMAEHDNPPQKK
jgi:hypothetical protein